MGYTISFSLSNLIVCVFLAGTFIKHHSDHVRGLSDRWDLAKLVHYNQIWWLLVNLQIYKKKKRKKKGLVNHLSHPVFHLEILRMCGLFNRWAHINPQLTCQTGPLHTHLPAVLSLGNLPRLITPFIGSAPFGHGDVVCQAMG